MSQMRGRRTTSWRLILIKARFRAEIPAAPVFQEDSCRLPAVFLYEPYFEAVCEDARKAFACASSGRADCDPLSVDLSSAE